MLPASFLVLLCFSSAISAAGCEKEKILVRKFSHGRVGIAFNKRPVQTECFLKALNSRRDIKTYEPKPEPTPPAPTQIFRSVTGGTSLF